ncbi:MAG: sigma factor-like helix-turn-helix DNA-binding protein [Limisphaerales bacterium]
MEPHEIVQVLIESDGPVDIEALIEVSLHRPHRGTKWVAAFRDENGRPIWKTTGLRDREAALAVAQEWERAAKRKRAAQPAGPRNPTIRVRPGSAERELGLLTQKEVAAIMRISERSVREIERRAFAKLRRHPALKDFWREWVSGEIKEARMEPSTEWALDQAEIAAVYALARTPEERQALRKLLALAEAPGPGPAAWPD